MVTPFHKHCKTPYVPYNCIFHGTQVNLGSDLWVRLSVSPVLWLDLTDVTLADEDTKSIPTDNAERAIKGNVAMHVRQPGGQLWNQC